MRGAAYDRRWAVMAERGESVHGEVDFLMRYAPRTVLDAGCGTGRVAIELAHRGVEVLGVDLDPAMLDIAREKAPDLRWVAEDLAQLEFDEVFDVVVAAGNVAIFLQPGTEPEVIRRLAECVDVGGCLIAGFQLGRTVDVGDYDAWAAAAGLLLIDRYSSWDGDSWDETSNYAVSVHRRVES